MRAFTHLLSTPDATTGGPLFDEVEAAIFLRRTLFSLKYSDLALQFDRTEHEVRTAYERVRVALYRHFTAITPAS